MIFPHIEGNQGNVEDNYTSSKAIDGGIGDIEIGEGIETDIITTIPNAYECAKYMVETLYSDLSEEEQKQLLVAYYEVFADIANRIMEEEDIDPGILDDALGSNIKLISTKQIAFNDVYALYDYLKLKGIFTIKKFLQMLTYTNIRLQLSEIIEICEKEGYEVVEDTFVNTDYAFRLELVKKDDDGNITSTINIDITFKAGDYWAERVDEIEINYKDETTGETYAVE